jgi:hypothetical protein
MNRQAIVGWGMIAWSAGYILYFLKTRLFFEGPPITGKEWLYFCLAFGGVFLGTINVRMAAARRKRMQ